MVDLFRVLPHFPTTDHSHILPSLDKHRVTTNDILTLDPLDLARRAQVPPAELKKLSHAVLRQLHAQLGFHPDQSEPATPSEGQHEPPKQAPATALAPDLPSISTLDPALDAALAGGIPAGYLVELTGESGAGKTQFLLTLLLACQLPPPHGLAKSALYISTEAPLATTRLSQLLETHPYLASLPSSDRPSLSKILSIQTHDLESQDHILRYQLPVAVKRHNVGLVVLDSVAANFRAELEKPDTKAGGAAMAKRSTQLTQLGALLRDLARTEKISIVVANQVADRFAPVQPAPVHAKPRVSPLNSQPERSASPAESPLHNDELEQASRQPLALTSADPLVLDHQQRWFTGWGEDKASLYSANANLKTPSLGLVWTNQLAGRIALLKDPVYSKPALLPAADGEDTEPEIVKWRRHMKLVFASWAAPTIGTGIEYEIATTGIRTPLAEADG